MNTTLACFIILSVIVCCYAAVSTYQQKLLFNKTINGDYELDGVKHSKIENIQSVKSMTDDIAKKLKWMYLIFEDIADKYGIVFWAWGGTLLGAYRHTGFIPWDDDMDFATDIKNKEIMLSKAFNDELESKGVKLTYNEFALPIFRLVTKDAKNLSPPFIDIFFSYDTGSTTKVCFKMDDALEDDNTNCSLFNPEIEWDSEWIYPVKKVKFEDISIYVPNNQTEVIIREFSKEALTTPLVQHNHAGFGWLLPATGVTDSGNNKLGTFMYWVDINPLNWFGLV